MDMPLREAALKYAVETAIEEGHSLSADSIVARAEVFLTFLRGGPWQPNG